MTRKLRIFIVDDDRDFADSIAEILHLEGHEVAVADSGERALEMFSGGNFDITFMDVRMPGMNGVESFLEIRKSRADAKVVMMTAYSVEELLTEAVDNGALGVLHKPFALPDLLDILKSVLPSGVVLVVDDDPDLAESLRVSLTAAGYSARVAHNGREALEQIASDGIDLLILDLRLPVLSGFEVYLEVQRRGRAIPTVFITGFAEEEKETLDSLRSMAAAGCLVKPFDPEELIGVIDSLVAKTQKDQ